MEDQGLPILSRMRGRRVSRSQYRETPTSVLKSNAGSSESRQVNQSLELRVPRVDKGVPRKAEALRPTEYTAEHQSLALIVEVCPAALD
jgi:hypothetical protein